MTNGYRTDVPAVSAAVTELAAVAGRALMPIVVLDPRLFAGDAEVGAGVSASQAQRHADAVTTSLQLLARDTGGTFWEEGDTLASVAGRLRGRVP